MHYKLLVNVIEIYSSKNDPHPKFYSKTDLVDFKIENKSRVILSFKSLGRVYNYSFEDVNSQEITALRDFFGL